MFRISIGELESQASLVLAQGNPLIMGGMRPVPPNIVYCGMMQVCFSQWRVGNVIDIGKNFLFSPCLAQKDSKNFPINLKPLFEQLENFPK